MSALKERENVAKRLHDDIGRIFDTVIKIDFKRFNSQTKYTWKLVYTGYTNRVTIFKRLGLFKKSIVIYDIEDMSCYERLVEKEDSDIFEVIEEANSWIIGELEMMRKRVNSFLDKYLQHSHAVNENIKAYKELSKCLEE